MAEERAVGLVRAPEEPAEQPSKEGLQRRMNETRDSISHTVTEIKETVANQVQAVKDALDWREQFRKRPLAWSCGAAGVGFLAGYGLAAAIKDRSKNGEANDFYSPQSRSYAAQPIIGETATPHENVADGESDSSGPGLFQKISQTPAYGRVRDEAGNVGDAFIHELGKTATQFVLPALITSIKKFLGAHLPSTAGETSAVASDKRRNRNSEQRSTYQPSLERGQS